MSMVTNEFPSNCGRYYITSYGNGWAYQIEELHSGRTVFFQDSEACTVQELTSNFDNTAPLADYFDAEEYECFLSQESEFDR